MARSEGAGPPKLKIYFSDFFGVSKPALEKYGAFNVSLLADLPRFVDPFLLFNSKKAVHKSLHDEIIKYLGFLKDRSVSKPDLDPGLLNAWYRFPEIGQNWLGFAIEGNRGRGLGPAFAKSLHA